MNLMFAPLPGRYAAVRIDPLGTVERYDYPDIQAAARAIPTRTYLVYLKMASHIHLPSSFVSSALMLAIRISTSLSPADLGMHLTLYSSRPRFRHQMQHAPPPRTCARPSFQTLTIPKDANHCRQKGAFPTITAITGLTTVFEWMYACARVQRSSTTI